jgi:hypothetical protein
MIETEDDFLRGVDHRALDINEQAVGVGDSFKRDPTGAHNGDISVNFFEAFDCQGPDEDSKAWINDAA